MKGSCGCCQACGCQQSRVTLHPSEKKEREGDKGKKDILQIDCHKNNLSLSVKNDCGMKPVQKEGLEGYSLDGFWHRNPGPGTRIPKPFHERGTSLGRALPLHKPLVNNVFMASWANGVPLALVTGPFLWSHRNADTAMQKCRNAEMQKCGSPPHY